jgi:hypothetical protein
MMALLPIILFVTTDIYEKVKIRHLNCIRTMRKQTFSQKLFVFSQFHLTKRMTFMSKFTKQLTVFYVF